MIAPKKHQHKVSAVKKGVESLDTDRLRVRLISVAMYIVLVITSSAVLTLFMLYLAA